MNEHLPYEDELMKRLEELPLPAEDMAWEDMKRRLDKDDDMPLIPPFFKGCTSKGIALLLLAIALVFMAKWFHKRTEKPNAKANGIENKMQADKSKNSPNPTPENKKPAEILLKDSNTSLSSKGTTNLTYDNDSSVVNGTLVKLISSGNGKNKMQNEDTDQQIAGSFNKKDINVNIKHNHQHNRPVKKVNGTMTATVAGNLEENSTINTDKNINQTKTNAQDKTENDTTGIVINTKPIPDLLKKKNRDTSLNKTIAENDAFNKKHLLFGAGLALYQLLPVDGQKSTPYNSLGRKSSLGDYMPSVYARIYQDKKWFIQSEFRYGAPQYTKDIVYIPKKIIDSSGTSITSESKSVKKTFYHQLPVSFNYFILPGLSVGTGITFNRFSSALVQQDIHKTGIITQADTLITSDLVTQKKTDSNFVKSYIQALLEAQYQWKHFSFGARYSFGLQPYLQFTLPGGEHRQEKNSSLQIFIRYELWQSRRRNK